MLLPIIFILTFVSVVLICKEVIPVFGKKAYRLESKRIDRAADELGKLFLEIPRGKLFIYYGLSPIALGLIGFALSHNYLIALVAAAIGLILPKFVINGMKAKRRMQFSSQLVDGLMLLSGSLKAGLSLLQAIESLVEEMPPPISQEFGLVLRENRMGIPLDESLEKLNERMRDSDLSLIITAILVARESGGDLTRTITQLIQTIREKQKLLGKVRNLTVQGRLQGVIMSLLPIAFGAFLYFTNPKHLNIMINSEVGRMLLGYAVVSQIVGIFLIRKFSQVEV